VNVVIVLNLKSALACWRKDKSSSTTYHFFERNVKHEKVYSV